MPKTCSSHIAVLRIFHFVQKPKKLCKCSRYSLILQMGIEAYCVIIPGPRAVIYHNGRITQGCLQYASATQNSVNLYQWYINILKEINVSYLSDLAVVPSYLSHYMCFSCRRVSEDDTSQKCSCAVKLYEAWGWLFSDRPATADYETELKEVVNLDIYTR